MKQALQTVRPPRHRPSKVVSRQALEPQADRRVLTRMLLQTLVCLLTREMRRVLTRIRRHQPVLLCLTGALLLFGCLSPLDPIELHGQACLTLIHTSDLHSRLFPYSYQTTQTDQSLGLGEAGSTTMVGGAARLSFVIGRERARSARVLHLNTGDTFQGAPVFNTYAGEAEVRALSQLGTDAMVIGNHELDKGATNLAAQLNHWATFPVLAANYWFHHGEAESDSDLGRLVQPFATFTLDGLTIAVIGIANVSAVSPLSEIPSRLGITPLHTTDTVQFYVDLLRPLVDFVVVVTHLGLEADEKMIESTTGIDVVLGGHDHIVLNPPKLVSDCGRVGEDGRHFIEVGENSAAADEGAPAMRRRNCSPRSVVLVHSGAFAKVVGRLDLVISDAPADLGAAYDPADRFEVLTHRYHPIGITDVLPNDASMQALLEPYRERLDALADLDLLVGYAPQGSSRRADRAGDSPLGNLVATAIQQRASAPPDLVVTNTTGLRADLASGAVSVEDLYRVLPFDNSVVTMPLSGMEVQDLFDLAARRSASRGCQSQVQIAGARVVLRCGGCSHQLICVTDDDCGGHACQKSGANRSGMCTDGAPCAEHVFITRTVTPCSGDNECPGRLVGSCDASVRDGGALGRCWVAANPSSIYQLGTSSYLAEGGSGYDLLARNTSQRDTGVDQRELLIDYLRQGRPCGYSPDRGTREGLEPCASDHDCAPGLVCACLEASKSTRVPGTCASVGSCGSEGRCVLQACRDDVAARHLRMCGDVSAPELRVSCETNLDACQVAGEVCKRLACIDTTIGSVRDGRVRMIHD